MKLSLDCEVEYHNDFLDLSESKELFEELIVFTKVLRYFKIEDGSEFKINTGKIMFLDKILLDENRFPNQHWGETKAWTPKLKLVKEKIEKFTNHKFEVCVLIYYPDGNASVDYHSDYTAFGDTSFIPSISLGEEREFKFRKKESGDETALILENGSLVIMGEHCQERYEHSLPINPRYKNPRINLTFRKYGFDN